MQTVLDKAQDDLEKAQEAACELNLSRLVTIQTQKTTEDERDQLKVEHDRLKVMLDQLNSLVEGSGASLTKAREEAVQEYIANFKGTGDYLDILNDATEEYKASLNRVDPYFDAEYYDNFILE